MTDTRTALDLEMEDFAENRFEQGECLAWQGELTCPCCGGSGEHIGPRPAEIDCPCSLCEGMGVLKIARKRML